MLVYWLVWTLRIIGLFLLNLFVCIHALFDFILISLTPLVSIWCTASSLNLIYKNHACVFLLIPPIISPWTSPEMRLCTFLFCMFSYLLYPQFFYYGSYLCFYSSVSGVFGVLSMAILIGVLLREPHVSHVAYSWKFLGASKPMRTTAMEMDSEDEENDGHCCWVGWIDSTVEGISNEQFIQLCIFPVSGSPENGKILKFIGYLWSQGLKLYWSYLLQPNIVWSFEGMFIVLSSTMVFGRHCPIVYLASYRFFKPGETWRRLASSKTWCCFSWWWWE